MRKAKSNSTWEDGLFVGALESLPEFLESLHELWPVWIVIGVVFGLIWLLREIFRASFTP